MRKGAAHEQGERGRQVVRQWKVLRAVEAASNGLTVGQLLDVVDRECSERTLFRDLEHLQAAGFPLTSDEGRWGVLRGDGGHEVPGGLVRPSELFALFAAEGLLESTAGSWIAESLRDLRGRVAAALTPEGRAYLATLSGTFVATLPGAVVLEGKEAIFGALRDALERKRRLRLRYAGAGKPETSRKVDPSAIVVTAGRPYLFAWCHSAEDLRVFAIQRIEEAVVLDEAFERDPSVDALELAHRSFGVFQGPRYAFAVDLAPEVAHQARERRFHPTQRVTEGPDGWVRVSFEAAGVPEVATWVAGLGGMARAVAPPELVEAVRIRHEDGLALVRTGSDLG